MKKVVTAAAAAAFLAGALYADVKVSINSRTRPSLYTKTQTYAESNDASNTSTLFDFGYANHSDDFTFEASNDVAGAHATLTLSNNAASVANGQEATTTMVNIAGSKYFGGNGDQELTLDGEYYGYVQAGGFRLTGGTIDERFISNYDDTLIEGGLTDGDTAKWGVSNLLCGGYDSSAGTLSLLDKTFLFDFNNTMAIAETRHVGIMGAYTLKGIADGELTFKAAAFANQYSTTDYDEYDYTGAGFTAEVDYESEIFAAQAIFKNPTEHTFGFGLYGDIKAVERLNLALGVTYGFQKDYEYEGTAGTTTSVDKFSAFALDLRAFYNVIDPLTVGLQAKYSSYTEGDADAETGFEAIVSGQYKLNDKIAAQLDAGLFLTDLDDNDKADMGESYIQMRPGVMFLASEKATVTTALEVQAALNGDDADKAKLSGVTKMYLAVPVILRIKL